MYLLTKEELIWTIKNSKEYPSNDNNIVKENISAYIPRPSKDLKEAIKEVNDIESGKIHTKGYHDIEAMIKDILK